MPRKSLRILPRRTALPGLAVLLVLIAGAAAHANRPVPYGDRLAVPGMADATPVSAETLAADGLQLRLGPGLEAYDRRTGAHVWSYRREGATALHLVRSGTDAVVLWDDGLVTAVQPADHLVRWHRAVPGLAAWLRSPGEDRAQQRMAPQQLAEVRARAALQPVTGPQPWVGVFTPTLAMSFRDWDGDLRWTSRPPADCTYDPQRAVRTDTTVVMVSSCPTDTGEGHRSAGAVTGYELEGKRWSLPTGPQATLHRLDDGRIAVDDGPVLGTRLIGAQHGNPLPACGAPGAVFAAQDPAPGCPAAPVGTASRSSAASPDGSPPADR